MAWPLAQAACGGGSLMPWLIGSLFLLYFIMIRPQARERATRDQMLKELKKNDKVMTIGGIYGIVASVTPDKDEVVLKVDEESNTKIKFSRASIHRVISAESTEEKKK
jgi:preprotein translocase subunit YajC